jgi:hypothetical protein
MVIGSLALVDRCLVDVGETFVRIGLRTSNPVADAFYRSIGFEAINDEDATTPFPVAGVRDAR